MTQSISSGDSTHTGTRGAPAAFELRTLPPLDTANAVPLYIQLAERLAAPIHANHASLTGCALPSEAACAAYFGVSRPTVRQAVQHLAAGGLVARGRGRGTFVAPRRNPRDFREAFEEERRVADGTVRFRVLERREIPPPAAVARHLCLSAGETVLRFRRCRTVNGVVRACEQRFLPACVAQRVTTAMLEEMTGVPLLTATMRQPPLRVLSSLCCRPAAVWPAQTLGVDPGMVLPEVEHTYHAASGRPLMHGTVWYRPEAFVLDLDAEIDATVRVGGGPQPSRREHRAGIDGRDVGRAAAF